MLYGKWIFLIATAVASGQTSQTMSLNGEWDFALASGAAAEHLSHFYESGFKPEGFHPIPVPSNWALLGYEEPIYGPPTKSAGEGFYLYRFQAPVSLAGKRVLLHFGGVWASAEVWLNSQPLGRHDSGFTGFAYDVSAPLKPGAENRLAVRVRQFTRDMNFEVNDDWSLGGIYRDVWLESMPAGTFIDRVETSTFFDEQFTDADLKLRIFVVWLRGGPGGRRDDARPYELRAILTGPDGKETQRASVVVPPHWGRGRDALVTMHVNSPLHWTAETPSLYRLNVELVQDGKITHSRTSTVGFRQVSTAGGVFRINGQAVKLRGVCRHDENPDVGRATRRENWFADLRMMKAANINMIRTSHYPPAEGFIELCDEMGMYVLDEVPMKPGNDPSFIPSGLLREQETIARDRNHPSVVVWSIGNEQPLTVGALAAIRAVKGADPTRPVLMPYLGENFTAPEVDILSVHYSTPSAYDLLGATADRPVITTEYTHGWGEEGFGGLQDCWRALTQHPNGAGGSIWMWQDQGLARTRVNAKGQKERYIQLNFDGMDGIVSADRKPQRDYWETKAVYAPTVIPVDSVHFWPNQASVRVPVRNEYDFTDLSSVEIHWSLMADDHELAKGEARVHAPPHVTGYFRQPLDAIKSVEPGTAYYTQLSFLRPDGSEIVRRSVELLLNGPALYPDPTAPAQLRVRSGKTVVISAGQVKYEFDPASAQLVSASIGGAKLIAGSRFTIWRPLNPNEMLIVSPKSPEDYATSHIADLNRYTTTIKNWKVAEDASGIRIEAQADHKVDAANSFATTYSYLIGRDGILRMQYSVQPRIEFPWLPEIGLEFETAPSLDRLRWLGLGPLDAYPNEKTASIFGVYEGRIGTDTAKGTKAIRWAELTSDQRIGLRVKDCPYIRVDGRFLRVLPSVVGRPNKHRRPEAVEYRLDTGASAVFHGGFSMALVGAAKK